MDVVDSVNVKKVYVIELTCPAEEGINNAAVRKQVRYDELKTSINSRTVWTVTVITIEAGARGFVGFSMRRFLSNMGFKSHVWPDIDVSRLRDAEGLHACHSHFSMLSSIISTIWWFYSNVFDLVLPFQTSILLFYPASQLNVYWFVCSFSKMSVTQSARFLLA